METFPRGTKLKPWFVSGFSDGQGSFTYSRASQTQLAVYFSLKLTRADAPILEEIQAFFGGAGRLYEVKARVPARHSGHTKAAMYYRVTRRAELLCIVKHFDRYPLQTPQKRAGYSIWRQMVLLKQNYRRVDSQKMNELAHQLTQASVKRQPPAPRQERSAA